MKSKKVLVTGATGQQGGAVVNALLERGHEVRVLVRNSESAKAKALAEKNVELFQGDFDDSASIVKAASGVDGAFIVSTPFAPDVGVDGEIRQGIAVIEALKRAAVSHVVFSSVSDADRMTGIPHFDSKARIEEYLVASGLNYTITAPVYFSDNTTAVWNIDYLSKNVLSFAMPADKKLQVISIRDIGVFNAIVLERGGELAGKRYNIAGDELSGSEQAQILAKITGRDFKFVETPIDAVRGMSEDLALMFEWFVKSGYTANLSSLRSEFSEVGWQTYEDWARSVDWGMVLK